MRTLSGRLLIVFTIALLFATSVRLVRAWKNDSYLGVAAGSYIAMAADLSHGEFYRPLIAADGSYGGTRYFPLYWVLITALIKVGIPPIAAGYAISFLAFLLLLTGMYSLQRLLGIGVALSICGAMLVLSSEAVQFLLDTIRADVLATALNLWGLVFCITPVRRRWHLPLAAVCFSLAFATKATAEIGVATGFLVLFLANRKRDSFKLLAGTVVGCLAVLGLMYVGSSGRALEIIRKCASGGYPPRGILRGSMFGLHLAWSNDHAAFLLLLVAFATLLSISRQAWKQAPAVLFVVVVCVTIFIYSYLSQDLNHLLDLVVASVLLAMAPLAVPDPLERADGSRFRLGFLALIVLLATGWVWQELRYIELHPERRDRLEAFIKLDHVSPPILAENPLIPVLLGQRAYVADPFMFGVLRKQNPSFAEPLLTKMKNHEFSAIVLFHDPRTADGRDILITTHFGAEFLTELDRSYVLSAQAGENLIYRPRP